MNRSNKSLKILEKRLNKSEAIKEARKGINVEKVNLNDFFIDKQEKVISD